MLDRMLNPNPTFYKWDKFWTGFLPALVLPVICFFLFFLITLLNSRLAHHANYSFQLYWFTVQSGTAFLRTASLCCIPNAVLFFFFLNRNYFNASRAVVFTTMLYVIAIVIKDMM
jgi:hypothetical protein